MLDVGDGALQLVGVLGADGDESGGAEDAVAHARGNIVHACKTCNDIKAGADSHLLHPRLNEDQRASIESYIASYAYDPDISELRVVLGKLYEVADRACRAR